MLNKENLLKDVNQIISDMYDLIESKESLHLEELEPEKTALIIVDMINGFTRIGALSSPRVERLIPEVVDLSLKCDELGIKKLAFADSHTSDSPEFNCYPRHCLKDSEESLVVSELEEIGGYDLITKNSTNGFLEPDFLEWFTNNGELSNFIVVGDCTDICILQFVTTLKTHFNSMNEKSRIIVPINAVDTYDLGVHHGDLMNLIALYQMMMNDIEVVKNII